MLRLFRLLVLSPIVTGLKEKFYQYTDIDEYSRFRFIMVFKGQSTYSSAQFVNALVEAFEFPIECIQTDNGLEFIKSFSGRKKENFRASKNVLKTLESSTNLSVHTLQGITVKFNAHIEKITNTSAPLINSTLLMISKFSLPLI